MGLETGTLLAIGAITSAVASAGGTFMSYTAQRNQAKASKAMGEYNNKLAQQAAENTNAEAAEQAHRMRIEKRRALADINAQTAASGAVMEGSPLAVLGETSKRHEVNIADTMRKAQIEAQQTLREGELNLWESKEKARGYKLTAYGTLLEGISSLSKMGIALHKGPTKSGSNAPASSGGAGGSGSAGGS